MTARLTTCQQLIDQEWRDVESYMILQMSDAVNAIVSDVIDEKLCEVLRS